MGWITMSLRRNELQSALQDNELKLMQLSRRSRQLSNFSSVIGDGKINPSEIASLGHTVFGDALDFMVFSNQAANEAASMQRDYYADAYGNVTQQQYYNSPAMQAEVSLYYDMDGNLNTEKMYEEFYEEALKEYAQTVVMPKLKELEEQLANEKMELETERESMSAELESVKQSISQSIQSSTIRL